MSTIPTSASPSSGHQQSPAALVVSGLRKGLTVLRMGLAFFFPWPFLTEKLEATVAERAGKHHPRPSLDIET